MLLRYAHCIIDLGIPDIRANFSGFIINDGIVAPILVTPSTTGNLSANGSADWWRHSSFMSSLSFAFEVSWTMFIVYLLLLCYSHFCCPNDRIWFYINGTIIDNYVHFVYQHILFIISVMRILKRLLLWPVKILFGLIIFNCFEMVIKHQFFFQHLQGQNSNILKSQILKIIGKQHYHILIFEVLIMKRIIMRYLNVLNAMQLQPSQSRYTNVTTVLRHYFSLFIIFCSISWLDPILIPKFFIFVLLSFVLTKVSFMKVYYCSRFSGSGHLFHMYTILSTYFGFVNV